MTSRILEGPKFTYPKEYKTLGQFFFDLGTKNDDRICQIDATNGKTETYASVKLRTMRAALELQKRSITKNDVIVVCSENSLDNTIPIIGTLYLGAKIANLDPSLSVIQTRHLLSLVTPKIIFVQESSVKLIEDSLLNANFQPEIVVFGTSYKYQTFSNFLRPQIEKKFRLADVDPKEDAILIFSSGTTGLPKAVTHSHESFLAAMVKTCSMGWGEQSLHFTSFYWITAMLMLTACYRRGSYRIFCRTSNAEDVFRAVEKYKIKTIFTAPILTYNWTKSESVGNYDLSSVELVTCSGTPVSSSQLLQIKNVFKNAFVTSGYGMTEFGFITVFNRDFDEEFTKKKSESCGKPMVGVKLKVVDLETQKKLPPNQHGELRVQSPSMMKGYYKMQTDVFDEEGFVKTGDVGYYDEEGCVYVVGRTKEMFKYQSWHIVPSSIEAVLLEHPAVKEVVVVGIPHNEDGEIPAAVVVLEDGSFVSRSPEIERFLEGKVSDREKLRGGMFFVEELPKTPTSKVIRREARDVIINLKKN